MLALFNVGCANKTAHFGDKLIDAAYDGDVKTVLALLNKGANIDATEKSNGCTALIKAAEKGNADVVKLLVDKGANVDAMDKSWRYGLDDGGCKRQSGRSKAVSQQTNFNCVGKDS